MWASNGTGHIEAFDLRAGKMQGSLKGPAGSVRSLALHPDPSQRLIASVGLDRHLRVHSTTTRQCLSKVYVKTQMTDVAWAAVPPPQLQKGAAGWLGEVSRPCLFCFVCNCRISIR